MVRFIYCSKIKANEGGKKTKGLKNRDMRGKDAKESVPQKIPSSLRVPLTDSFPSRNRTSKRAGLSVEGGDGRNFFFALF